MPTGTFEYRSDAERLALETAIAFVAEMHQLALTAAPGHVLDQCEQQALGAGRALLRSTVQQAVQACVTQAEKNGATPAPACAGSLRFKRRCDREVVTALGAIRVERSHGYCQTCRQPEFAASGCAVLAQPLADAERQRQLEAAAPAVLIYFCGHRERLG